MLAFGGAHGDDDGIALALGVLLDHDGVGTGRDDSAGKDARGFARADAALERMAGRDLADELEPRRHPGDVGGAHGITVHRRDIRGRLRTQRRDVGRQHAPVCLGERRLLTRQRLRIRKHTA